MDKPKAEPFDNLTFAQCRSIVDFYVDRAPLAPWSVLGRCFAETEHPVIVVWQRPTDGVWVIGCGRDAAAQ